MTSESFLCALRAESPIEGARPGRFVLVDVPAETALRRPLSIAGLDGDRTVELLVERRGRGTEALGSVAPGSSVSIIGPLGNGFTQPGEGEAAVLVAGGIGAAGLRYLAAMLPPLIRARVLVGARTSGHLLDGVFARREGTTIEVATEDGSAGLRGTVCDLLERALDGLEGPARVYCCGPPAMIRTAAAIAAARGLGCEASVEEIMACGVGACRGCVVATRDGYRTACTDGPVFDTASLVWDGVANG